MGAVCSAAAPVRSPRYPLDSLAQLRAHQVDEAARAQGAAVRRREEASVAHRTAEERREAHAREAASIRDGEQRALLQGELHAVDLARADAWAGAAQAQARGLDGAVERAAASESEARRAEAAAQQQTAARQAEAKAVANDRARWEGRERRKDEAKAEEALSEACRRPR
jgi:hypothetical protein